MLIKDMKPGDSCYIAPWELIVTPQGQVGVELDIDAESQGGGTATVRVRVDNTGKFCAEIPSQTRLTVTSHRNDDLRIINQ